MNTRRFCLLLVALLSIATVRADDDVMKLYDQARKLTRAVKRAQVEFLITKEPALRDFPVAYFDTPEVAEIRDRLAFEYLWNKGQLRNPWNSYISGTRNMLSDAERNELAELRREFVELEKEEADGPGRFFATEPRPPDAAKMMSALVRLSAKYRQELWKVSEPLEEKLRVIESQIVALHLKRKKA
jgi:hypothetical protein